MALDRNHKASRKNGSHGYAEITAEAIVRPMLTGEDCTGPINLGSNLPLRGSPEPS